MLNANMIYYSRQVERFEKLADTLERTLDKPTPKDL